MTQTKCTPLTLDGNRVDHYTHSETREKFTSLADCKTSAAAKSRLLCRQFAGAAGPEVSYRDREGWVVVTAWLHSNHDLGKFPQAVCIYKEGKLGKLPEEY